MLCSLPLDQRRRTLTSEGFDLRADVYARRCTGLQREGEREGGREGGREREREEGEGGTGFMTLSICLAVYAASQ